MANKMHQSIRVFENSYLEKLTHVHPIVPLLLWAPIISFLLYRSVFVLELPVLSVALVGACAFVFWTLAEYLLHRFVFHFKAVGPVQERLQFLIHGLHHADPVDPTRLVMPPAGSLILGVILFSLFRLPLGPVWVEPFFAFFVVGYLCYDYIHFAIHHFNPRTRLGKWTKKHHMMHHFATPDARWGVSSPFWDYIFGTADERADSSGHLARASIHAASIRSDSGVPRVHPAVTSATSRMDSHENGRPVV